MKSFFLGLLARFTCPCSQLIGLQPQKDEARVLTDEEAAKDEARVLTDEEAAMAVAMRAFQTGKTAIATRDENGHLRWK